MSLKVLKFGGTSLATSQRIDRALGLITRTLNEGPVSVVVSAFGGVTNALLDALAADSIELAQARLVEIGERYALSAAELGIAASGQLEITACRDEILRLIGTQPHPKLICGTTRDQILASGELLSALLLVACLRSRQVNARLLRAETVILTDNQFGAACVDLEATTQRIRGLGIEFFQAQVVVLPGFTGATAEGETTTLGRNASDYSAAIFAAALRADLDIYTDVAGVFSADPNRVAQARVLPQLSYRQAHALAAAGASVIHASTLAPFSGLQRTIRVLDSFQPDAPGTTLSEELPPDSSPICAVALHLNSGKAIVTLLKSPFDSSAAAQVAAVLCAAGINAQTPVSVEPCVHVEVSARDGDQSVHALHEHFVLGIKGTLRPLVSQHADCSLEAV